MAGIGFELRKVIGSGGLGSFLKAAVAGIMIVAGPWLLSIIGISLIQRFLSYAVADAPIHFMGVIIYSYAWSLIIFGGFHYIFTRSIADFIFERKEGDAAGALIVFSIPVTVVSAAISIVAALSMDLGFAYSTMFRAATVLLFVAVNMIWLAMLFISMLKWFVRILVVYAGGMGAAVGLVFLLGKDYGVSGALLGFALGHVVIATLLLVLGFSAYKPKNVWKAGPILLSYFKRFWILLLTGLFYNWGIWIDKVVYWFTLGEAIPGTFMSLFPSYDIVVYFANLTMIPGLVYFVIVSETAFYVLLRRFLVSLARGTYAAIQRRKLEMLKGMRTGLREQSLFQGMFTIVLVVIAPTFAKVIIGAAASATVLRFSLAGVFFHLCFLTLMNYLFYLEYHARALWLASIFFTTNLVVSLASGLAYLPIPPGASYCVAGIAAMLYGLSATSRSAKVIDRKILSQAG